MSLDVCLAMNAYSPIQRNDDPLGSVDVSSDIIQVKLLGHSGVGDHFNLRTHHDQYLLGIGCGQYN